MARLTPQTGIVDGAVGLACIIWGLFEARKGARTRKWPKTRGVITLSMVEPDYRGRWGIQNYRVVISYKFSVAGSSRVGHQVAIGDVSSGLSPQMAQRLADRYATGTAIDVYYDPLDPSDSVLERGISGSVLVGMLVGVLFLGFGVWLFLRGT